MKRQELVSLLRQRKNTLCIGLDPDLEKIPKHLLSCEDPVYEFNKAIIEATSDICVAYKPNLAFYEALGPAGWYTLEKTMACIPSGLFTIADAKRGDIGNTSSMYAKAFFARFHFDAITVAPYMGRDSVEPFLAFEDKWVILLGLTSNAGSADFQQIRSGNDIPLYASVIEKAQQWGTAENLMFVVGATHPDRIAEVRKLAPESFFLVPGIGAQGGDLRAVIENGRTNDIGLLINSSRDILYAGQGEDFAEKARERALSLAAEMELLIGDM